MKKYMLMFLTSFNLVYSANAQNNFTSWNVASDLQSFSIVNGQWVAISPSNNTLGANYYQGANFGFDANNYMSIVNPISTNEIYFGRWAYGWTGWNRIWHSGNFNPDDYLIHSNSIGNSGTANSFSKGYTFSYATSGTPWNGSLISYGGFSGNYDTQISSDYGPNGGNHISFRTKNGDANTWNAWYEIYHSGNLNRSDVDFTAKTINSTNVFANGNIWAKEIKVALSNPFPDYVFKSSYHLPSLLEVKSYIDKNHRLPDMPSEQQVIKDGLNLGEMNTILVKKVEEITLYIIQQQKEIDELKKMVLTQNETIKKLAKN